MIQSGFFNSVNGDRRYNADFFARFFGTLIGNGVFPNPSTGLQVYESSNMTVTVRPGKGWINGYFIISDSDYNLTLDTADGVLNRIDRIVMRLDYTDRKIDIAVKKGAFASTPVAPTLQRDADYYELALADIYVGKGVTAIIQSNINDQRLNTSVCGIVKGLIDQVDTTTIFNQYQAWFNETTGNTESTIQNWLVQQEQEFNNWFATVQNTLSGDVAGNLSNQITTLQQNFDAHKAEFATFKEATEVNSANFKNHITDYVKHPGIATTTNNGNDYAVNLNPAPTAYVNAMGLILTINVASTGAATINVNGLGAIPIKKADGSSMKSLKAGGVYTLRYSNSAFILQGEGGDYIDSLMEKIPDSRTGVGIAQEAINENDHIQVKYQSYLNTDYKMDIPITNGAFGNISRDGTKMLICTTSTTYFYKRDIGSNIFIKQPLTIQLNSGASDVELSDDGQYVVITSINPPYVTIYKLGVDFTTSVAIPVDIQPPWQPRYLDVSRDGSKILVSPYNNPYQTNPNAYVLYIRQSDGKYKKMGLPDVYQTSGYSYQCAMSKDGTTILITLGNIPGNMVYKINNDGSQTKQIINNPMSGSYLANAPTLALASDDGDLLFTSAYGTDNPQLWIYKRQVDGTYTLKLSASLSGMPLYLNRQIGKWDFYNDVLALTSATSSRSYIKIKKDGSGYSPLGGVSGYVNATVISLFDNPTLPYPLCMWSYNGKDNQNTNGFDTVSRYIYKLKDNTIATLSKAIESNLAINIEFLGFATNNANTGEKVEFVSVWGVY